MRKMKNMNEDEMRKMTDDFVKVITFELITTIKNHYGSLEAFKAECRDKSNRSLARFIKNFHIDTKVLQSLTRDSKGNRHLDEVLKRLDKNVLVYKHKSDVKHKSGKMFSKPSTFYIPFKRLDSLFAKLTDEASPFNTKSSYYTDRQRKLIDRLVFGYKKERKPYTKTEKFYANVEAKKQQKNIAGILEKQANGVELSASEIDALVDGVV